MARTTTKSVGLTTDTEYTATLDAIADLTVKRDKAQARLDKAILTAREEHGSDIEDYNDQIASRLAMAESYALRNRSLLLSGDSKSAETGKARWGFRLGNPTLVLLSKRWTWRSVADKLRETGRDIYLKITDPKPDKDRLKADLSDEDLASLGMRIEQTESYWVEPKTDTAERINS